MKLRIWWIPQVPMTPFYHVVRTLREASLLLDAFAEYDTFQLEHNIKPDYANCGGLQVWERDETTDDPAIGSWVDWEDDDGIAIDDLSEAEIDRLDIFSRAEVNLNIRKAK